MKELRARAKVVHRLAWLWEPLEPEATFVLRAMFGSKAVYLDGRLVLAFCTGDEPWRGVLVCTSREHHAALQAQFASLRPHPILPKWLYLPESADDFERTGPALVRCVQQRDPRIGITPQAKRRPRSKRDRIR